MSAKVKCSIKCDGCGDTRKTEFAGPIEFRESLARHGWWHHKNEDYCAVCQGTRTNAAVATGETK